MQVSRNQLISVGKYLLGIFLGVGLLYLAFKDISFSDLQVYFQQVNYGWLGLSLCFGALSHFVRALRWRMQLRASGYDTTPDRLYAAVMIGYLVNLALPRAGELARCSVLYRSDRIPLPKTLGTVAIERVFDVLILGAMVLLTISLEYDTLISYFDIRGNAEGGGGAPWLLPALLGLGVLGMAGFFIFRKRLLQIPLIKKGWNFVNELMQAALSIRHIKRPWLFVVYTLIIWVCYVVMTYVAFFALPDIANLPIDHVYMSIIVTAMGGIGMAMPVQGGIGAYHTVVAFTFKSLAIGGAAAETLGLAFATIIHAAQNVGLIILFGGIGYIYLSTRPVRDAALDSSDAAPSPENPPQQETQYEEHTQMS